KQMWLRRRKSLENDQEIPDRSLPWYFQRPWEHWTLSRVLLESGNSDFVFFRRRKAEDPPPQVWEGSLPPFLQAAGLTLPVAWKGDGKKAVVRYELPVPEDWRGRHLWVSVE